MSTAATACPRCGEPAVRGQGYCLECGVRLDRRFRDERPTDPRPLRLRVAVLAAIAAVGAAIGIWMTWESTSTEPIVTALGGSVPSALPKPTTTALAVWPAGADGWTIVLSSVPKVDGRDKAVALAEHARDAKLRDVGVIDSSRYASLRPGYWVVFQGIYESEAEANGSLSHARRVSKVARAQAISS